MAGTARNHAGARGGRDLTAGPITPTLLAFALPTLASNMLQSLNASINAVWVGRYLGEAALAATSNANLVTFLMMGSVFGFGMAATILVGQAMGRGDVAAARHATGTAVGLFTLVSIATALLGWWASPAILHALATPPAALPLASAYLRVIFLGMPATFLVVLLGMALRGAGDSTTPFYLMIANVVLDAGLNPVFILGLGPAPRLGIAGSALATTVAGYLTLAGLLAIIYLRDLPIRLRGRELRWLVPARELLRVILVKGLPMGAQMIVISASALAVIGIVNHAGVDTTAAYGVTAQLWSYVQMPALAISAAVSAMAAQNIGAGAWDRVGRITRSGVATNIVVTVALAGVLLLVDRPLLALFLGDRAGVIAIARHINPIGCASFVPFGVTIVMFGTVRANGAVAVPLAIFAFVLFPVRFGLIFALQPALGIDAVWWSLPLGSLVSMVLAIAHYARGGWRRASMATPAVASGEPEPVAGAPAAAG